MVNRLYRSKSARRLKARPSKQMNDLRQPINFNNGLDRDIFAMKKVLKMLRLGSVRWLGEVGRQY
jgi:hypothetical protein